MSWRACAERGSLRIGVVRTRGDEAAMGEQQRKKKNGRSLFLSRPTGARAGLTPNRKAHGSAGSHVQAGGGRRVCDGRPDSDRARIRGVRGRQGRMSSRRVDPPGAWPPGGLAAWASSFLFNPPGSFPFRLGVAAAGTRRRGVAPRRRGATPVPGVVGGTEGVVTKEEVAELCRPPPSVRWAAAGSVQRAACSRACRASGLLDSASKADVRVHGRARSGPPPVG